MGPDPNEAHVPQGKRMHAARFRDRDDTLQFRHGHDLTEQHFLRHDIHGVDNVLAKQSADRVGVLGKFWRGKSSVEHAEMTDHTPLNCPLLQHLQPGSNTGVAPPDI